MEPILVFVAAILVIIYFWVLIERRPKNFPPGPTWFPWFGNIYQLRKCSRSVNGQHIAFEKWSEKYQSPLIGLKLGREYVIVGLTYPIIKEIHTREEFQARPDNFFLRMRTMGTRLGITCTDGDLWAEHRNFVTRHLRQVGYGRFPMEMQIQYELNELINLIHSFNGKSIWPGSFLPPSVINVLWTLTTGKRIERNDKTLQRLLYLLEKRSKAFDLSGGILSQMPWLRFIAPEWTGYNLLQCFNMQLHEFFMETINEHKKEFQESRSKDDLIFAYIKEMKSRQNYEINTFTDLQLTMTILDIFIAGSQTTSNTLNLAFMMMVAHPQIQEKIANEIGNNLRDDTIPSVNMKKNFPYTEAVLMEVQRFFHITPITGPRRATCETKLGDYTIPKDSTILIALRSVLMDQNHWKDPEIFRPERFLNKSQTEITPNEYFIPFGQGKRRCLGDSLARACLFTFFVGILKIFQLKLPENEEISTKLLPGITLSPTPYKIQFIIR